MQLNTPYFKDTADLADGVFSSRAWLANITYYLGFYCLQGHLFHSLRAMGVKFEEIPEACALNFVQQPSIITGAAPTIDAALDIKATLQEVPEEEDYAGLFFRHHRMPLNIAPAIKSINAGIL